MPHTQYTHTHTHTHTHPAQHTHTQHSTAQHSTAQHSTAQHSTAYTHTHTYTYTQTHTHIHAHTHTRRHTRARSTHLVNVLPFAFGALDHGAEIASRAVLHHDVDLRVVTIDDPIVVPHDVGVSEISQYVDLDGVGGRGCCWLWWWWCWWRQRTQSKFGDVSECCLVHVGHDWSVCQTFKRLNRSCVRVMRCDADEAHQQRAANVRTTAEKANVCDVMRCDAM
jgi:hypothetical protein